MEKAGLKIHLERDLGFDRKKKLELTLLMEQEYGIPIDKNQIYRVHDAILSILSPWTDGGGQAVANFLPIDHWKEGPIKLFSKMDK